MANYISVENQKALSQVYGTGVKLALVMSLSVVILMFVARFIPVVGSGSGQLIRPVFIAVLILGPIAIIIRRLLLSQAMISKIAQRGVNALLSRMLLTSIICQAIAVLIGILGLTFYLVTGDYEYSLRLGVVSILLVLYGFPRRGEWERILSRNTQ